MLCALSLLGIPVAEASPNFDLYISTGGVTELAVGQVLSLRALHPTPTCLPSRYVGTTRKPVPATEIPLVWSLEPEGTATIDQNGLLTALKPGQVVVHVACRDPKAKACALTMPGKRWLNIRQELPGGRLPRLDRGPAVEAFQLQWDATPFQSRHELVMTSAGAGFAWSAGFRTGATPETAFPWILDIEKDRRGFDDDEGVDEHSEARHRANVTSARLTVSSWEGGLVSGRIEMTTTRGVVYDTTFQSRLDDRDGVLARAVAKTSQASLPAQGPATK